MKPTIDTEFDRVSMRLPAIPWAKSVGRLLSDSLVTWCRPVVSVDEAIAAMKSENWEAWSADRGAALSIYLHDRHRQRFLDWNAIAKRATDVVATHEAPITAGLQSAGLSDRIALDTVKWDLVAALTCAGFMDCRPPTEQLKLLDIYEAGHLPVGWDAERKCVLVY